MQSAKWLVEALLRFREPLRPLFGHVKVIFEPDTKLAGNHNHGFIRETHALGERRVVASNKVGPLMNIEANPVSCSVGSARQLIVGPQTMTFENRPSVSINRAAEAP